MGTAAAASGKTGSVVGRSSQQVVEAFISALERLDFDEAVALTAPTITWVNHPWKTASNRQKFDKALRAMFKDATRFDVQYRDIHERGEGIVFTDRIDVFEGGGVSLNLPVQGEFRVQDGLITEWVDRFSWGAVIGQIARSFPAMIKHRLGG